MGIFKVSTNEDRIKDSTGSNYITESGIYEVVIKHVLYNQSQNGSTSLDLVFDYNGQEQIIFSAIRLTNNNGSENFEATNFNKLCIIMGMTDGVEIEDPVPVTLPIGKNKEMKDCYELNGFQEQPIFMRVQMEYRMYEGEIRESKKVRNFFRYHDKATASEIVNDTKHGNQFTEEEKTATVPSLKDGITEADVAEFKKNRAKKNTEETKSESTTFTKRRTFGKVSGGDTTSDTQPSNVPF